MEEKTTVKKTYLKPVVESKRIELPVMACTCTGSGSLQSFLALATSNFTG